MERAGTSPPAERPRRRFSAVALGIALLAVGGAATGFIVTGITAGGVSRAGQWVVGLRTTLDSGATVFGTGIVLTASGQVVTTYAVVDGAVSIDAQVNGGSRYAASTFALDPSSDVAVLQLLNAADLPSASIGNPSMLGLGDTVTAIGLTSVSGGTAVDSPGAVAGLESTTDAVLSGTTNAPLLNGLIEADALLPANGDGGPLVDGSGNVVGLDTGNSSSATPGAALSSATLAIPIDRVMSIVHEVDASTPDPTILQGHGAYLGVDVQDSTVAQGARIVDVSPGTPASIVGMTPMDVIVSIDGAPVDSIRGLRLILARYRGGDHVVVGWVDPAGQLHRATTQLAAATFT